MAKNGNDEAQQAAAQEAGPEEPAAEEAQRLPVMGLVVINPQTGQLMLQINEGMVKDKMQFFLAITQLGLGNAMSENQKQQASKILVPKRQVQRLPKL